jgi:hypothetical protein
MPVVIATVTDRLVLVVMVNQALPNGLILAMLSAVMEVHAPIVWETVALFAHSPSTSVVSVAVMDLAASAAMVFLPRSLDLPPNTMLVVSVEVTVPLVLVVVVSLSLGPVLALLLLELLLQLLLSVPLPHYPQSLPLPSCFVFESALNSSTKLGMIR